MSISSSSPGPVWSAPWPIHGLEDGLEGSHAAEFVVIGAGFAGLAAALELRLTGCSVILVDAGLPLSSASCSSAGQVGPLFLGGGRGPADAVRVLGRERGEAFARLVAGSGRWLFDLVEERSIACAARKGYVCLYRNDKSLERAAKRFEDWRRVGGTAMQLGREDLGAHIASGRPAGGFFLPDGGMVNPARLIAGLLGVGAARGIGIHYRSPIISISGEEGHYTVHGTSGHIKARAVIVATGLDPASPLPELARTAYGAGCGVAATAPLADRSSHLLPGGGPVADLDDKAVFAPAISEDGRLVCSFLLEKEPPRLPRSANPALRRLERAFPGQTFPPFETLSWGRIAITSDGLPRLIRTPDGIIAVSGCNGFGLTLGMSAAREAARLALGVPAGELCLPVSELQPVRGAGLAPFLMRNVAAPIANRLGV